MSFLTTKFKFGKNNLPLVHLIAVKNNEMKTVYNLLEGLEGVGIKLAVVKPCKNGLAVEPFNLTEKEAQAALRATKIIYGNQH